MRFRAGFVHRNGPGRTFCPIKKSTAVYTIPNNNITLISYKDYYKFVCLKYCGCNKGGKS